MRNNIAGIEYDLPEQMLTNDEIAAACGGRSADELGAKTGVVRRHIAAADEWASDLAVNAAKALFATGICHPKTIDFVLMCTQCPDFLMPSTAAIVHGGLGLRSDAGALDFNGGCSGFVYGLGLAHGLIETGQARDVLLITAETYSKFIDRHDRSTRSVFGDAAAACLIRRRFHNGDNVASRSAHFLYGTDGRGARHLCMPRAGLRALPWANSVTDDQSVGRCLYMNGLEVSDFVVRTVPSLVHELVAQSGLSLNDVDAFVFHQASKYVLDKLQTRLGLPAEKVVREFDECGNTASCSIPIALKRADANGRITPGQRLALVGFGSGYSWSATLVDWRA